MKLVLSLFVLFFGQMAWAQVDLDLEGRRAICLGPDQKLNEDGFRMLSPDAQIQKGRLNIEVVTEFLKCVDFEKWERQGKSNAVDFFVEVVGATHNSWYRTRHRRFVLLEDGTYLGQQGFKVKKLLSRSQKKTIKSGQAVELKFNLYLVHRHFGRIDRQRPDLSDGYYQMSLQLVQNSDGSFEIIDLRLVRH